MTKLITTLNSIVVLILVAYLLTVPPSELIVDEVNYRSPMPSASGSAAIPETIDGIATWYDATKNYAWFTKKPRPNAEKYHQEGAPYPFYVAAGPELRALKPFKWGDKPYRISIYSYKTKKEIIGWVVDECMCRRLVDLSPSAFVALGIPLGVGIQKVRVTILP
jgi:rare lipoprotein A (peptidoglycan hydrolase)